MPTARNLTSTIPFLSWTLWSVTLLASSRFVHKPAIDADRSIMHLGAQTCRSPRLQAKSAPRREANGGFADFAAFRCGCANVRFHKVKPG
jgi:hypothetical protein